MKDNNEIRAMVEAGRDKACARRGRACLPGHAAVASASARLEDFLMLRAYQKGAPLLLSFLPTTTSPRLVCLARPSFTASLVFSSLPFARLESS